MTGPACDLCGLGCGKHPWTQRLGEIEHRFCCVGCQNVFLILAASGIAGSGQDFRETELFKRSLALGLISRKDDGGPSEGQLAKLEIPPGVPAQELLLQLGGLWCTSRAWLIEHVLRRLPGVASAEASFASDLVKVKYYPQYLPPERIISSISQLGYSASEYSGESEAANREERDLLVRLGLAAFLWLNIMTFSMALYVGYFERIAESVHRGMPFLLMALATPVVFYCAQPIFRLVWRGVKNRTLRMEALLGLGISVAYGYSAVQALLGGSHVFFDTTSGIVTAVLAGKALERNSKARAARWITTLHQMLPNKVRLLVAGREHFASVAALAAGEVFVVKAGERIAADGCVVAGESHADEALLTGESAPVAKRPGDKVVAGSVNQDGVLHVQATRTSGDSTLARIIALVNQALTSRSPLERTADRVARVFVPCIMLLAGLTFVFWYFVGGAGFSVALMRAITVLIVACPCALGLATPLAITAAMGSAAREGILVSDSSVLETLGNVDNVILDKTGTVTEGKFSLLQVEMLGANGDSARAAARAAPTQSEVLLLLASIEQYSEHPLGKALVEFVRQTQPSLLAASDVTVHKGKGISGRVEGREVFVGNRHLSAGLEISVDAFTTQRAAGFESEGKTITFFGWDGRVQGLLAFGDKLRPEAVEVVAELRRRGSRVHLVSGDSLPTTRWIASCLGVDSFQAEVLPGQKAAFVRDLQGAGAVVAMVGDGINDAPALAQADLGIAMGSGADIAMKAAAVVLMTSSLDKVSEVFSLAARTLRVVRQNLFWAFLYNLCGISLAVAGFLNPIFAAAAMLLSSLSVVANSLRLNRPPRQR
jgi:heavy metal translocating P-type ATPase